LEAKVNFLLNYGSVPGATGLYDDLPLENGFLRKNNFMECGVTRYAKAITLQRLPKLLRMQKKRMVRYL
jgi:hypothetical protein